MSSRLNIVREELLEALPLVENISKPLVVEVFTNQVYLKQLGCGG